MNRVKVSYPFIFLVSILVALDDGNKLIMTICAMLIHEAGHIFGLMFKKIPFKKITVGITGANIIYGDKKLTSYKDDIVIAVMGSCFNFAAVIMSLAIESYYVCDMSFFVGINVLSGMFNMLPIMPLDGGRALVSFIAMKADLTDIEKIMRKTSIVAALIGFATGIMLIAEKGNYTLVLVSTVIFMYNVFDI